MIEIKNTKYRVGKHYFADYICECGKVIKGLRRDSKRKHCGCKPRKKPKRKNFIGQKFAMLTVISKIMDNDKILCRCDCGNVKSYNYSNVVYQHKKNVTKSCGCLFNSERGTYDYDDRRVKNNRRNAIRKHWAAMIKRCSESYQERQYYFDKGIKVYEDWKNNFESFRIWALENGWKKGLTLDRINPMGNYEPNNCRWATHTQQARNKVKSIKITIDGVTKHIKTWLEDMGRIDDYYTIHARYKRGIRGKDLFKPIRKGNYSKTNF